MSIKQRPPRSRWHISVRALMVVTLVIGCLAGWLAHRIRTQRQAIAALNAQGARITLTHQKWTESSRPYGGSAHFDAEPPGPRWLRRWIGDELFQSVGAVEMTGTQGNDITPLAACDRLEYIELFLMPVPEGGFAVLHNLRHLKTVVVEGPAVTDSALADLARVESIEDLKICRSDASPKGWGHLADLRNLKTLQFNQARLDGATFERWSRGMPRLEQLDVGLQDGVSIGDAELIALARINSLLHLGINGARVTDAAMPAVARMPHLVYLALFTSPHLTDAGIAQLARSPSLERIHLYHADRLTDAGLAHLATAPKLTMLTLGHSQISPGGIEAFRRAAPQIKLSIHK